MGRVNKPTLTVEERKELTVGFKQSINHCFRMHCHCILLKPEGRTSKEVGSITGMCAVSVNNRANRYRTRGFSGLQTQPGRGRKAILLGREDKASILAAITSNRQRARAAKAQREAESGKSASDSV